MYGGRWSDIFREPSVIEGLGLRAGFRGLDVAAILDGAVGKSLFEEMVFDETCSRGSSLP